ncbi:MAG: hypothetical protein HY300_13155 [Verrucomicrobia bacterium]|nr:hypothetical protein [Verrucomicrobiota bacterium]
MRFLSLFLVAGLIGASAIAMRGWQAARAEKQARDAAVAELSERLKQKSDSESAKARSEQEEVSRLRAEAGEVHRLRNEVTQFRGGAGELDRLRSENKQLRAENQQFRAGQTAGASPQAAPQDRFARDQWKSATFTTPEAALMSAISAMRDGKPQAYLDSLGPDEQLRMAKAWEGKAETDIAAKHQNDVAAVTGLRILDRQDVSPTEVMMSVYLEGINRFERVSMKLVGTDWKFGGYVRTPVAGQGKQ